MQSSATLSVLLWSHPSGVRFVVRSLSQLACPHLSSGVLPCSAVTWCHERSLPHQVNHPSCVFVLVLLFECCLGSRLLVVKQMFLQTIGERILVISFWRLHSAHLSGGSANLFFYLCTLDPMVHSNEYMPPVITPSPVFSTPKSQARARRCLSPIVESQ